MTPTEGYRAKIISPAEAEPLRAAGWKRADIHAHTNVSHDVPNRSCLGPDALYTRAVEQGLDFITFTDHDTLAAYDALGERERLVRGVEMTVCDPLLVGHTIHVNVYELDKDDFDELQRRAGDLPRFLDYCRQQRLPFMYNHPYWFEPREEQGIGKRNIDAIRRIADEFPVIEYNMKRPARMNRLATKLAAEHGKGMVCTTDSHTGHQGESYTLAKGETFREFFANVAAGEYRLVAEDLTRNNLTTEVQRWVEHFFSPELISRDAAVETGKAFADKVLTRLQRREQGLLRASLEKTVLAFTRSGLPAWYYLRGQERLAAQIEQYTLR